MPKKSTRDGRRKLNEAQLRAYRARKAATVVETPPEPATEKPSPSSPRQSERLYRRAAHTTQVTAWGHVGEEYEMIRADLKRLFAITAMMFIIIIVLWFILA